MVFLNNFKNLCKQLKTETLCVIVDCHSILIIQNAVGEIGRSTERVDQLQKDKISDQKTIIQLQKDVIKIRSNEVNDVKSTVQSEDKTFSSILKKNVPQTLSKKTIKAAVKSEEEHRSKNVVIYGL